MSTQSTIEDPERSGGEEESASVVGQVSPTEEERGAFSSQRSGGGGESTTQDCPDARRTSETPSSLPYSKTFFCPLSGSLLLDPVVSSDGISYHRTALEERGDDMSKVYENRSLKAIIDEAVEYQNSSTLKRLGLNVRQLSQQLLVTAAYNRPLPEGFYCPITLSLIHAPVIDPEGYSYEKLAIENWIRCNGASPVTRRVMTMEELYPNTTLAALMMEEKGKSEDVMHPLFKQWKEEPLPMAPTDVERAIVSPIVPPPTFPSTPEELDAANRRLRMRLCNRVIFWTLLTIVLGTLSWMVPVISTVILVFVLIGVGAVVWFSSNSLPNFGAVHSSGLRPPPPPPPPRRQQQRQPVAPNVHEV